MGLASQAAALGELWRGLSSLPTASGLSQNSPPPCPGLRLVALGCADDGFNVFVVPRRVELLFRE